jgi:hypothetical protein
VLREVRVIAKAWSKETPKAKREIVGHLVVEARLAKGEAPVITWRSAEDLAHASE